MNPAGGWIDGRAKLLLQAPRRLAHPATLCTRDAEYRCTMQISLSPALPPLVEACNLCREHLRLKQWGMYRSPSQGEVLPGLPTSRLPGPRGQNSEAPGAGASLPTTIRFVDGLGSRDCDS